SPWGNYGGRRPGLRVVLPAADRHDPKGADARRHAEQRERLPGRDRASRRFARVRPERRDAQVPPARGRRGVRRAHDARHPGAEDPPLVRLMQDLTGTVAFVVGGSRGLGADLAAALHRSGARTVSISRRAAPSEPPWEQELLDAADPAAVERLFATWAPRLGDRNV